MSDLSSTTIWGKLTVNRDAQIKDILKVNNDIYEKDERLEDKYGAKSLLETTVANVQGNAEALGNLKPIAGVAYSNNTNEFLDGTGKWRVPPDTKYTAGSGITLTTGNQFKHSNAIAAGTIKEGGASRVLANSGTFKIPSINYDSEGHITGSSSITLTLPKAYYADEEKHIHLDTATNKFSLTDTFIQSISAMAGTLGGISETVGKLGTVQPYTNDPNHYLSATGHWTKPIDTTYTAGLGLALNGTQFYVKDEYVKRGGSSMSGNLIMSDTSLIGVGTASPNFGIDTDKDIRVRENNAIKMGGVGAEDVKFEMKYDEESKSVTFSFF